MKKILSFKESFLVGLTLFGLFFGAGNLIFPVHMGQLAGRIVLTAVLGFIVTGVTIPILGVVAIGMTHTDGLHDLSNRAGKGFGYRVWAILFTVFSFAIANVGLSKIIEYSVPALMLLYPFTIVLIALALCDRLFGGARCVYVASLAGAGVGAVFDFLKTLPFGIDVGFAGKFLPLFDLGLGWLVPAAVGCAIGVAIHLLTRQKAK